MAFTAISKPTLHFNTKLFTGNGSTNAITGVGFQPGLTWLKSRSGANDNQLYDSVRTATKYLRSESSDAEGTAATGLTAFNTDGFTLGSAGTTNNNSASMASWNWKANGAGSSNSDGSVTSTVSANTTAGFSIVKFNVGASGGNITVGHGLGATPRSIWIKSLTDNYNWDIYHEDRGAGKRLNFNTNNAESSSTYMNSTAPTNQVFTFKQQHYSSNANAIAYCFTEKYGFSTFGSYTGTGAANSGPFVYCGFSPGFIMVKKATGSADSWFINDNKRAAVPGHNPNSYYMRPNETSTEGTSASLAIDIKGTGFKIENTDTAYNNDNSTYVYWAFAAEPLVGSNNVCSKGK